MKEEYERGTVVGGYDRLRTTYKGVNTPEEPYNNIYDNCNSCVKGPDLHSTMDADVWAEEFCNIYRKLYNREIDEEWVHSWMCNAIMCGYDHQSWKRDKQYIYILKTTMGDILKVFHYEPNQYHIREEYEKHYHHVDVEYDVFDYIRLFRWSRDYGLMEMNGPKSDTQYEWKSN